MRTSRLQIENAQRADSPQLAAGRISLETHEPASGFIVLRVTHPEWRLLSIVKACLCRNDRKRERPAYWDSVKSTGGEK
jgi:hypothetical protein